MYACMHVCMYACMHVCMYARMHVCIYACMHVCTHACMHVCMHAFMYACMQMASNRQSSPGMDQESVETSNAYLVFQYTNIPYQYTNIPICLGSMVTNIPIFHFPNILIFKYSIVFQYSNTNIPIYQYTNIPWFHGDQYSNIPFS